MVTRTPASAPAEAASQEEERRQRQIEENRPLSELLRSWLAEDDEEGEREQRETWEFLKHALDEDRLSGRKLFP